MAVDPAEEGGQHLPFLAWRAHPRGHLLVIADREIDRSLVSAVLPLRRALRCAAGAEERAAAVFSDRRFLFHDGSVEPYFSAGHDMHDFHRLPLCLAGNENARRHRMRRDPARAESARVRTYMNRAGVAAPPQLAFSLSTQGRGWRAKRAG